MLDDSTDSLPQISTDSLQFSEPPNVSSLFPKLERIAEAEERLAPGLRCVQPVAPIGGRASSTWRRISSSRS